MPDSQVIVRVEDGEYKMQVKWKYKQRTSERMARRKAKLIAAKRK